MTPNELEVLRCCTGQTQSEIRRSMYITVGKTTVQRILVWFEELALIERAGAGWKRTDKGNDALAGKFDPVRIEIKGRPQKFAGIRQRSGPRKKTHSGSGVIAGKPYATRFRWGPGWLQ